MKDLILWLHHLANKGKNPAWQLTVNLPTQTRYDYFDSLEEAIKVRDKINQAELAGFTAEVHPIKELSK